MGVQAAVLLNLSSLPGAHGPFTRGSCGPEAASRGSSVTGGWEAAFLGAGPPAARGVQRAVPELVRAGARVPVLEPAKRRETDFCLQTCNYAEE